MGSVEDSDAVVVAAGSVSVVKRGWEANYLVF